MFSRDAIIASGVLLILGLLLFLLERKRMSAKELSLVASMAALAAIGRIPFAALPGLQCASFVVILGGAVFGPSFGFSIGAASAVVSNCFLGHGPWTFFQMIAWGLCGASAGMLASYFRRAGRLSTSLFGLAWGYVFGWIMNLYYWLGFVYPLSLSSWLAVNAASFPFDTAHALTNAGLCWFLFADALKILRRFESRLSFSVAQGESLSGGFSKTKLAMEELYESR